MAAYGRSSLRDLFDESPTPHIAHPPRSHYRDYYIATDGSFRPSGAGLGAVIESGDGERVARLATVDGSPNNNVAEYKALHRGLDELTDRTASNVSVGILVDHDRLASNVNTSVIAASRPSPTIPEGLSIPPGGEAHWEGIQTALSGFTEVRAARIDSGVNPAHPLANAPDEYRHLEETPRGRRPSGGPIPPPSRADRARRGHSD